MPANLTPMYLKAEREYRRAQSVAEQIECLQLMLQQVPKHKGTDKLQADLKSRLSEARQQLRQQLNAPKSGPGFRIPRQGAGQIVIAGGPNCGKSRILKQLTRAEPEVAEFPFTTRVPLPAILECDGVQLQLIDTPPVTPGRLEPWMLNLVRTADAVLLVMDGASDDSPLETAAVLQEFSERKTILTDVSGFDESSFSIVKVSTMLVVTHAGDSDCETRIQLLNDLVPLHIPVVQVELDEAADNEHLKQQCFSMLRLIRVFTKRPGQPADLTAPLTIPKDGTVEDLALQIHEDLAQNLKYARVWRTVGHEGQTVGREYVLREGDVVELH